MSLRIYNTLTRTKEEFKPLDPKNVRMYVCGPTVYDYAHIGNARPAIVFDVLFRLLRHLYGPEHVTYVRNITDVDDKINARALRDHPGMVLNAAIRKVTETTYEQYQKDVTALGCLPPTHQPRATEHIAGMVEMIQVLLDRKYAYVVRGEEGREALFDVKTMGKDYGQLSRRSLSDQQAGARIAVEKHKRNPEDFVLWKESRDDEPGWNAEFRLSRANADELKLNSVVISIRGRPGWHIECSVMSKAHLGEVFDIHGGGLDLIFPHHENEIAQSRCAHGTPVMANYWLHNGFLQVEGQKMSKSLGNFTTIADVLKDWPGEVARFNMLKTHYRQPIDWTTKGLEEAEKKLFQWSTWALDYEIIASADPHWATPTSELLHSLYDDLNLPNAFAYLDQLSSGAYNEKASAEALFRNACFLGLLNPQKLFVHQKISVAEGKGLAAKAYKDNRLIKVAVANNDWAAVEAIKSMLREKNIHVDVKTNGEVHFQSSSDDDSKIRKLIDIRNEARMAKNWVESDRIRDELAAMGIQIKDNKDGTTTWEVKR